MNNDKQLEDAREELRMCQAAIGQIENAVMARQGWFMTIIAGAVAYQVTNPYMQAIPFLLTGWAITTAFYIVELCQRLPHHRAIKRTTLIEKCLRTGEGYDGPRLSETLGGFAHAELRAKAKKEGKCPPQHEWRDFMCGPRICLPYAISYLAVLIVAIYTM